MLRPLASKHSEEAIRFFLISLMGLGIDIGVAWALIAFGGAPDPVAAVVGFSIATVTNYFGHQFWTFRNGERRASLGRFMAFAGVVLSALAVRLLVLDWVGPLLPGSGLTVPIRLGLAAVASFFVSFLMSKFLVFERHGGSHVR
jgi:putative flippase GtrA